MNLPGIFVLQVLQMHPENQVYHTPFWKDFQDVVFADAFVRHPTKI